MRPFLNGGHHRRCQQVGLDEGRPGRCEHRATCAAPEACPSANVDTNWSVVIIIHTPL